MSYLHIISIDRVGNDVELTWWQVRHFKHRAGGEGIGNSISTISRDIRFSNH